ncbi:VanW family protein [Candidatus Gracilibacteria bacterium]|nr:VanW family protein [Candidatus Gracilibacteria bacterium]
MIKKSFAILLFGFVFLNQDASAKSVSVPKDLNLIFEDRIITLNFEVQPQLLLESPQHFLVIKGKRLDLDMQGILPMKNEFFEIQTQFKTQVSPKSLHDFFASASLLKDKRNAPVEINFDEKGKITFTGKPHNGYEIEEAKLVELINEALHSGTKNVRVPAKKVFSHIVVHPDLEKAGIRDIVAIGESNFTGSSIARRQNILAGANKFNGIMLKKSERFSFNKILESVKEKDGFVKELVIKGKETKKELGGGVCQVSTTAFRAAFSGGFPISQRKNHSYAVPYYKPFGLDAAIYLGALDLRFKNDSPGNLLIQTFIEDDNLFFVFYGTSDDRRVSFEGPFISDYKKAPEAIVYESEDIPLGKMQEISDSHDGFRAEWIRKITKDNEETKESFVSSYRPWPAKILKGKNLSLLNKVN